MAGPVIWHIGANAQWYSRLGQRVWSVLEVRFGVWPVAPGHQAGAVWTADGWRTAYWAPAVWDHNQLNLYGGYDEIWRVRLELGPVPDPVQFRYALYIDDRLQGTRYWDNNNGRNYERIV